MAQFMPKKRPCSAPSEHFHRFFALFGDSCRSPAGRKPGLKTKTGAGEIGHVIESTGFSSKTGRQTAHQTRPDLPDQTPRSSGNNLYFFFLGPGCPYPVAPQLTRPHPGPLRGPGWGLATISNRVLNRYKKRKLLVQKRGLLTSTCALTLLMPFTVGTPKGSVARLLQLG